MKMSIIKLSVVLSCISLLLTAGCATSRPLPKVIYPKAVYPVDHYPMSAESGGLHVAAVPFAPGRDVYADPAKAAGEPANGLNVIEAGVLPIRLIVINGTDDEIVLDPDQIIGVADSVFYRAYSPQEAVDLVIGSHAFKEAIKGSRVGPVVKSVLGGEILVEAVKGGVGGVASGGITGGASGAAKGATGTGMERAQGYEKALIRLITKEYTEQSIRRQTLYPGFIADGLIFLPSQAGITELRIQAYDLNNKKAILLRMKLN
jgi:hypothetical protein